MLYPRPWRRPFSRGSLLHGHSPEKEDTPCDHHVNGDRSHQGFPTATRKAHNDDSARELPEVAYRGPGVQARIGATAVQTAQAGRQHSSAADQSSTVRVCGPGHVLFRSKAIHSVASQRSQHHHQRHAESTRISPRSRPSQWMAVPGVPSQPTRTRWQRPLPHCVPDPGRGPLQELSVR